MPKWEAATDTVGKCLKLLFRARHRVGKVKLATIHLSGLKIPKSHFDRVQDGLRHGRAPSRCTFACENVLPPPKKLIPEGHCGCDPKVILELCNRADLARIKGVSGVYSDLLEKAGVDTVKELATRRPDNLHAKIIETNDTEKLTERPPNAAAVENWVNQAKELPKLLTY